MSKIHWMAAAVMSLAVAGCNCESLDEARCEEARDLAENPSKYLDTEVCVTGVVSERVDWPLTEHDYFKVVQGNSGVWVHGDSPPPNGAHVTVSGVFVPGKKCYSHLVDYVVCQSDRQVH